MNKKDIGPNIFSCISIEIIYICAYRPIFFLPKAGNNVSLFFQDTTWNSYMFALPKQGFMYYCIVVLYPAYQLTYKLHVDLLMVVN